MLTTLRMFDLHCHYLPGVDDGARTLNDGLALVRAAAANGIERIVLTPHVHPGRYDNVQSSLKSRFETFQRAVESAQIPVQLALAGEVRLCDELLPLIERGEVPLFESASGAKTLLLELPHSHVPAGSLVFIRWLQRRGIAPLLAHPERNKELMAHPQRLQQLREAGCLVQITAASVIGDFGERAQRAVNFFLENNWVNMVASDAHNLRHRPPLMREAAAAIAARYGDDVARQLFVSAPAEIAIGGFGVHRESVEQPLRESLPIDLAIAPAPVLVASSQPERRQPQIEPSLSEARTANVAHADLCDAALSRMRAELLRRAAEPNKDGAKAARILQLMNSMQAR